MKSVEKAAIWKAYLPVGKPKIRVSQEDLDFFAQRGVNAEQLAGALAVLGKVRKHVVPLLMRLRTLSISFAAKGRSSCPFSRFSLFVHDRESSVPTRYPGAYLDITLYFRHATDARPFLPSTWKYVRPAPPPEEIAGIDRQAIGGIAGAERLICAGSALYLEIVCSYPDLSEVDLLKQVGQHLHLLANVSQLAVR